MQLYTLRMNNRTIASVETDVPCVLPWKPKINRVWLRSFVASTLRMFIMQARS